MAFSSYLTIIIPALIAFAATIAGSRFVSTYMLDSGVVSIDHNKQKKPIVPASGGLAVAFGFMLGMIAYIFGASFMLYVPASSLTYLFATVLSVVLISVVGFLDDINVQRIKVKSTDMMDIRKGLKQWQKPVFTLIGAIPIMAINAGVSTIAIPLIGAVNFGIFYPLLIVPLAIIFVTNAFNLVGGFDGIGTGGGLVLSIGLVIYSLLFGTYTGVLISMVMVASLLAFLFFTAYPAKILPGDSLYFGFGAAFVAAVFIGNMEAFGVIIFIPYIIEFLLHAKKKFHTTDLGKLKKDNTFEPPYGKKISSWTHVFMNIKPMKEWEVSLWMWIVDAIFVLFGFALKFAHLL